MRLPTNPIPIKERNSMIFVERGNLEIQDGALVLSDQKGVRTQIPVGGLACILLEPGTTISHAAVSLAAEAGCLLLWVGEAGVRLYSAGIPGGARSEKLLFQAKLALDDSLRLKVVRGMYCRRFGENAPMNRSIEQLRGLEGVRVRAKYAELANKYGVEWHGRKYDPSNWNAGDLINRCISAANHCLYGICEAAILAAGYAPGIGFLHKGKAQAFVYDVADLVKFETVIPVAFQVAASRPDNAERQTRHSCRSIFRKTDVLTKIIPLIEDVLSEGGVMRPIAAPEAVEPALCNEEVTGDDGHRY